MTEPVDWNIAVEFTDSHVEFFAYLDVSELPGAFKLRVVDEVRVLEATHGKARQIVPASLRFRMVSPSMAAEAVGAGAPVHDTTGLTYEQAMVRLGLDPPDSGPDAPVRRSKREGTHP